MHEGRALAIDEPARLRTLIRGPMLELVAHGPDAADIVRRLPGVSDAQIFGERLHVTLAGDGKDIEDRFARALQSTSLAGVPMRRVQPSLEDVFIAQLSNEREGSRA